MDNILKFFGKSRISLSDETLPSTSTGNNNCVQKAKSNKKCKRTKKDKPTLQDRSANDSDKTETSPQSSRFGAQGKDDSSTSCCGKDKPTTYSMEYQPAENGSPQYILQNNVTIQRDAYMPVRQDDPNYNMNHPERGKAVIFNFDRWDNTNIPELTLEPRHGSTKDRDDLAKCLRGMDFDVEEYNNLTCRDFDDTLLSLREEDHSQRDCLVVAIMTHGEKNTVYMADGYQIPVNVIWERFEAHQCPTLAGKPKIFIIQACRGKLYDSGTLLRANGNLASQNTASDVTDSAVFSYVIPNAADIIVAFSCPFGHYSWRNSHNGSWFIQSICKVFKQYGLTMELQALFTTVAREVALNFSSVTSAIHSDNKRQVTSTSSTLIRSVLFKPKPPRQFAYCNEAEVVEMQNGVLDAVTNSLPLSLETTEKNMVAEFSGMQITNV